MSTLAHFLYFCTFVKTLLGDLTNSVLVGTKSSTLLVDDDDDHLKRLGVDGGLDDVHHHLRRD